MTIFTLLTLTFILTAAFTFKTGGTPELDKLIRYRENATALAKKKCVELSYPVKARDVAVWNLEQRAKEARHDWIFLRYAGRHRCGPLSVHAYQRIPAWIRGAFLEIHLCEGSWTANTGNGYHGGLQMDTSFMLSYGRDAVRKYGGWAEVWSPFVQIIVANRARESGRGFFPWPACARRAGLI